MNRPAIPKNIERELWAESMGYCMNPSCEKRLVLEDKNCGEMAHIKPHESGGQPELDNLLLLCRNCHKVADDSRDNEDIENKLLEWKRNGQKKIRQLYEKTFNSFRDLEKIIVSILKENQRIFDSYGPNMNDPNAHHLWLKGESTLVSNNERICLLLTKNESLFHVQNQEIIELFIQHVEEFKSTRDDHTGIRMRLFPDDFLSIFGRKIIKGDIVNNISPLQNMIEMLIRENRFIGLKIIPKPVLTYMAKNKKHKLHLDDGPRIRQIYFSKKLYRPHRTDVRLDGLQFFLQWLSNHNIHFEIGDYSDLTSITIKDGNSKAYQVKLYYSYCLSELDLQSSFIQTGWIIVNIHNWNGGPVSDAASDYADKIGIKLFNQSQFFSFCHKEII